MPIARIGRESAMSTIPSTHGQLLARKSSNRPATSGTRPIAVNRLPGAVSFRLVRRSWGSGRS